MFWTIQEIVFHVVRDASCVRSCGHEMCLSGVGEYRIRVLLMLLLRAGCPAGVPFMFLHVLFICSCFASSFCFFYFVCFFRVFTMFSNCVDSVPIDCVLFGHRLEVISTECRLILIIIIIIIFF